MNPQLLDKAIAEALCPMFSAIAPVSSTIAVVAPIAGPAGAGVALTSAKVAALSMLGAAATCPEVEIGPDPGYGPNDTKRGCVEYSSGIGSVYVKGQGGVRTLVIPNVTGYQTEFLRYDEVNNFTQYTAQVQYQIDGPYVDLPVPWTLEPGNWFEMEADGPATCRIEQDPIPVNPPVPDYTYIDESTNCTYNVKFEGFVRQTEYSPIQPVFEISADNQTLRNDGGRIGGCNFDPVIYASPPNGPGGPGGPPIPPIPVPPELPVPGGDDVPWWAGPLLGGAAGAGLVLIGNAIDELLAPTVPEGSFTLKAPCNTDEQGNQLTREWTFPVQKAPERSLSHQIAILEVLQQHLDWRTPICDDSPIPEGDFRTISFRSDQTSPYGKSRLRKRFRYRSVSGNDLGTVVDHWKDFSFEAGPYRVRWVGGAWRSPEIWAASEAEGQRVIQHAAEEAGVSPLEGGRWSTRLSSSGRQGVPGTMRVDITGGFYWITARDGSEERPIVAKT